MTLTAVSNGITARICDELAHRIGQQKYSLWFDHTARFGLRDEETLCITVPTRFHADWIKRHFKRDLREIAASNTGRRVDVELAVQPDAFAGSDQPAIPVMPGVSDSAPAAASNDDAPWMSGAAGASSLDGIESACDSMPLTSNVQQHFARSAATNYASASGDRSDTYDLNHFVVGSSNELAYHAALNLAQNTAPYRNLFIYGGCGLGKTHLLEGICRLTRQVTPGAHIRYVTGEQFTNEFLASLRNNNLDAFRKRIRKLDLLAVDDVHFLCNKNATQNEFLYTFDAIGMLGAKVVMASDEHPRLIKQFHQRLISRFLSGMVVEVQMPDRATRLNLIHQMLQERGQHINSAAANLLAERFVGSVRELQGLMTRLAAFAELYTEQTGARTSTENEIGIVLVRKLLDDSDTLEGPRTVRVNDIIESTAEFFGIMPADILGSCRHANVVMARSMTCYLARKMTNLSYPELARSLSRRNHSTIVTACQRIDRAISRNESCSIHEGQQSVAIQSIAEQIRMRLHQIRPNR